MTQTSDIDGTLVNATVYTSAAVTDNSLSNPVTVQVSVDMSPTADVSNMTLLINGTRLTANETALLLSECKDFNNTIYRKIILLLKRFLI